MKQNPVVLCESDFQTLKEYVGISSASPKGNEMSLAYELGRAMVVKDDDLPPDTVKLNSKVTVEDVATRKTAAYTIVMPENADISQKKVSIVAPMGAALIGFRKGEEVEWKLPAGFKKFRIKDVENQPL